MSTELIDTIDSLALLMEEETARLQTRGERFAGHSVLTDAKLRLVATLERSVAELARGGPDWLANLDNANRLALTAALSKLDAASEPNARLLSRQIELSTELMSVVANEAQRATGTRSTLYGEFGNLLLSDLPAPISVNASL